MRISDKYMKLIREHGNAAIDAGISYASVTNTLADLITAIEELEAKVTAQEAEIAALKAEVELWQGAFVDTDCPSDYDLVKTFHCEFYHVKEDSQCAKCWLTALKARAEGLGEGKEKEAI